MVNVGCGPRAGLAALLLSVVAALVLAFGVSAAGPPFPPPVVDQAVYDEAEALSPATEAEAERIIDGIEQRTGAEVVVYTQVKPEADTPEEAEDDAIALMDQWGIGRRGFDDGLVILYDLDETRKHGQVQLYAGPGYRAAFLSNDEREQIFENDMVPLLGDGDLDGATLAALQKVDANATPEHAATLERARIIDGAMGLILAPLIFFGLVGWALSSWLRHGRDPKYLDDPSILMPAPPPDLTAAGGALLVDGRSSRRTLTTAMLDLASRGEIAFRNESGLMSKKVGIQILPPAAQESPDVARNRRKPVSPAEHYALAEIRDLDADPDGYIEPTEILKLGNRVSKFDDALEDEVVAKGWFRERPGKAILRWQGRGAIALIGGVVAFFFGLSIPSAGLVLIGIALAAAGAILLLSARAMPARTTSGAILHAMLAAYRRTLHKTLAMSRSMNQVVASRAVPWLETPDQAVVWGVALGLHGEVEQVLARSMEDARVGGPSASQAWFPAWYTAGAAAGGGSSSAGPSWGGVAPGLMAASALPDFGGMMAAVGTIGNTPSSSGSGGGGFSGGGSGGGGGGAGGGF
jgi:uncharacterized membrane protein YgcG